MDRIVFFLVAAVVCAALYPASDPKFRWVASGTALVYVVLALLTALDLLSRRRRSARSAENCATGQGPGESTPPTRESGPA
jgi:hypothetical protein